MQFFSPPDHFMPVSSGVAALITSALSFLFMRIVSSWARPSNFSVLPAFLISIAYLLSFFVIVIEESPWPVHWPSRSATLAEGARPFGSRVGEAVTTPGDADAAGWGPLAGVFPGLGAS